MAISRQQITVRGVAQQSGLDTFSSIINYTGEHINWGFPDISAFNTAAAYPTTAANPSTDALINNPPSIINSWYIFYTDGAPYTQITQPLTSGTLFVFYGQETGGLPSHAGAYQKLLLIEGKEYEISISKYALDAASTFSIQVYTPDGDDFRLILSESYSDPTTSTSESIFKATFKAESANDIFLISFTTEETEKYGGIINNFSIKEKQEYLIPVYATDMWGNAHKVLRVAADQIISTDET